MVSKSLGLLQGLRIRRLSRLTICRQIKLRHRYRQHLLHNWMLACVSLLQYSDNIVKLNPGVLQKNQDVKKQIGSFIRYFSTIIRHPRQRQLDPLLADLLGYTGFALANRLVV